MLTLDQIVEINAGGGAPISATSLIPEPSTLALAVLAAAWCALPRRR